MDQLSPVAEVVRDALRSVDDPGVGVNIVDRGLVHHDAAWTPERMSTQTFGGLLREFPAPGFFARDPRRLSS